MTDVGEGKKGDLGSECIFSVAAFFAMLTTENRNADIIFFKKKRKIRIYLQKHIPAQNENFLIILRLGKIHSILIIVQ